LRPGAFEPSNFFSRQAEHHRDQEKWLCRHDASSTIAVNFELL
jgi:hypothetical protein